MLKCKVLGKMIGFSLLLVALTGCSDSEPEPTLHELREEVIASNVDGAFNVETEHWLTGVGYRLVVTTGEGDFLFIFEQDTDNLIRIDEIT